MPFLNDKNYFEGVKDANEKRLFLDQSAYNFFENWKWLKYIENYVFWNFKMFYHKFKHFLLDLRVKRIIFLLFRVINEDWKHFARSCTQERFERLRFVYISHSVNSKWTHTTTRLPQSQILKHRNNILKRNGFIKRKLLFEKFWICPRYERHGRQRHCVKSN